jgi:molybdenum cofactor cytidylyltransferase
MSELENSEIAAIILAAGGSTRMGQPKMLLPWAGSTVLETVVSTLKSGGVRDILVITGAGHARLRALLGTSVQCKYNPRYEAGEMLSSIQSGIASLDEGYEAALIALGDQPQMQVETLVSVLAAAVGSQPGLVVPSHANRRGPPWLVGKAYWAEILAMNATLTMRDFFRLHEREIRYVVVDSPSVLADLDTPEDYRRDKPPGA